MARAAAAAKRALDAGAEEKSFHAAKIATARFFADHMLTAVPGLRVSIVEGATGVLALTAEQF